MAIEIVDFPIKHGDFPSFFVCLPEDIPQPPGRHGHVSFTPRASAPPGRPAQGVACPVPGAVATPRPRWRPWGRTNASGAWTQGCRGGGSRGGWGWWWWCLVETSEILEKLKVFRRTVRKWLESHHIFFQTKSCGLYHFMLWNNERKIMRSNWGVNLGWRELCSKKKSWVSYTNYSRGTYNIYITW